MAFVVAITADVAQLILGFAGWLFMDEIIDMVAMALVIALIGFHPLLLPTFVAEFIPPVDLLPTWTGCVAVVVALRRRQQETKPPPSAAHSDVIDI
jgi:hypothetical protein